MSEPETATSTASRCSEWWKTAIIDMEPGVIRFRGFAVEELIEQFSFSKMIWLMLRGDPPSPEQIGLFDAALTSAVDHGPQAPSIAIARMSATCGLGLNNAMASGVNALGDVHGGAGEQSIELFCAVKDRWATAPLEVAVAEEVENYRANRSKYIPGYGHRFHRIDPRVAPLINMVSKAVDNGAVSGHFRDIALAVGEYLATTSSRPVPMNVDGVTAAIYAELGFPAPLARGLFCLSRSVGILAHSWEQMCQGGRNKGPMPREYLAQYVGVEPRKLSTQPDKQVGSR